MLTLERFLDQRWQAGGFSTEDVLASFLPLLRQTIATHQAGQVAPLEGLDDLHVAGVQIWYEQARGRPLRLNRSAVAHLEQTLQGVLDIVGQTERTFDVGGQTQQVRDLRLIEQDDQPLARPAYLLGYRCWEHRLEHHDPLCDVFVLGLVLASLACGLNFNQPEDARRFVAHRENLFHLHRQLHPVLAQAIARMTELDRHRRPQDLPALLHSLQHYREQDVEFQLELNRIEGFGSQDQHTRQQLILGRLQQRLFEISRRNRLLEFRPTMQSVNLTEASVPLAFNVQSVRADQILTWSEEFAGRLLRGKPVSLNKYLNFQEALYLPSVLDRIRGDARRDAAEFGFAQLRLVACFLRWANLKESPAEIYDSPLVLLPVELAKTKGVRDTFTLRLLEPQAEINPVIRHQFQQLYGIELPETLDLSVTNLDAFYEYLRERLRTSDAAVRLERIDRPRIDLLHDRARRRVDQYRRRARLAGRGVSQYLDLDYSYDAANYHPLGIKLFSTYVCPPTNHLRSFTEALPRPRRFAVPARRRNAASASAASTSPASQGDEGAVEERQRSFFRLRGGSDNPYQWEFDLCRVTLANLRYRKMSLVRDYAALLADGVENPAFEATFSLVPRDTSPLESAPPLDERYDVVACDPTQAAAVGQARTGRSYIIQGPPGTGKSQTITNLIADFVARGQRVLFVCEKRAAIDVVFARLKQLGLSGLCCLIHDSQSDKKAFIQDLRQTYEQFLATDRVPRPQIQRGKLLAEVARQMQPLAEFHQAMQAAVDESGLSLRGLLERSLQLRERLPELTPLERERLPRLADWEQHREHLERGFALLPTLQPDGVFARHALRLVRGQLAERPRPLQWIVERLPDARRWLRAVSQTVAGHAWLGERAASLEQLEQMLAYLEQSPRLTRHGLVPLLREGSDRETLYQQGLRQVAACRWALTEAEDATRHWREKLPASDTAAALDQARRFESAWWAPLQPAWWRLRGVLARSYNFAAHRIRPRWSQVLEELQAEHLAARAVLDAETAVCQSLGYAGSLAELEAEVRALREQAEVLPPAARALHQRLLDAEDTAATVELLLRLVEPARRLRSGLDELLAHYAELAWAELETYLDELEPALDQLPDYFYLLSQFGPLPDAMLAALRSLPLRAEQWEAAVTDHSVRQVLAREPGLRQFNAGLRARQARQLGESFERWQRHNAVAVEQTVCGRFVEQVRQADNDSSRASAAQRQRRKRYNQGRRELEHEFGKSMRYKSIRDLVAGDSGLVIRDLKPVWLMSPLSVSDALPLDTELFDVVIFDEASQITLEEAIPSLFRARQTIVVGDEMQLPPTDFFSTRQSGDEDPLELDEQGEVLQYDLSCNSFLNHSARNLPSCVLGWHYRSRSESLISFSNWAFYQGRLLTVPEEQLLLSGSDEIVVQSAADAERHGRSLLARPVSFHLLPNAVYDQRRNRAEAEYIAGLVRQLLQDPRRLTLGVVAFSEAQQQEIEAALERLARDDGAFRERLEAEWEREEDGQFVGLLVKNLENIQGDERDVILLSVCYGHGPDGRMRMNFGPINKSGGEKRLNVAFSRARHHMAVISSIRDHHITNEFNDGARCLRDYLRYAAALSRGDREAARRVLHEQASPDDARPPADGGRLRVVGDQLRDALQRLGYQVDADVGNSRFRCDLAVRAAGDSHYRLGILIDHDAHYGQTDLLEREWQRPRLLEQFGWRVAHVLAKDWYDDPQRVLDEILNRLNQNATESPTTEKENSHGQENHC